MAVALKSRAGAMRLFTVRFDDKSLLAPEKIDLEAMPFDAKLDVGLRGRKALLDQAREKTGLQSTSNSGTLFSRVSPRGQNRPQARGAAPSPSCQDPVDLVNFEQAQDRCLLDQAPKLPSTRPPRHVNDGAGHRRARNAVPDLDLIGQGQTDLMPANVRDLSSRPVEGNDIDQGQLLVPQAEQLRRTSMRENRAVAAGKHSSQHASLPVDRPMADGEGAVEERVQAASNRTRGNCPIGKAEAAQLMPRNDTMLSVGYRRDRLIQASGAPFGLHRCIRRTGAKFAPRGVAERWWLDGAGGGCRRGVAAPFGLYG